MVAGTLQLKRVFACCCVVSIRWREYNVSLPLYGDGQPDRRWTFPTTVIIAGVLQELPWLSDGEAAGSCSNRPDDQHAASIGCVALENTHNRKGAPVHLCPALCPPSSVCD